MLIVIGALIVAGIGIVIAGVIVERANRKPHERFKGEDLANYRNSRLVREGIHLCAGCHEEYVPLVEGRELCVVCDPPRAPEEKNWAERRPAFARGYQPLSSNPAFMDIYEVEE